MAKNDKKKRSVRLTDLEELNLKDLKIDETLEQLDQGSPRLNWFYIIIGLVLVFGFCYLLIEFSPRRDLPSAATVEQMSQELGRQHQQIKTLEEAKENLASQVKSQADKLEALEKEVQALTNKNAARESDSNSETLSP